MKVMVDSSCFLPPLSMIFFMVCCAVLKNSEETLYKVEETKEKLEIYTECSIGLLTNCLSNCDKKFLLTLVSKDITKCCCGFFSKTGAILMSWYVLKSLNESSDTFLKTNEDKTTETPKVTCKYS